MKVPVPNNYNPIGATNVTMRCPSCGKEGTLESFVNFPDLYGSPFVFGQRRCPNPKCHCHIFVILRNSEIVGSYPVERLDFEKDNIPDNIMKIFEEAISCHANQCYKASAMMIRRTLEEICHDKGATGDDLFNRLDSLRNLVIIPKELLDGMHELRLLGNDAAHIEAKFYNEIGKDEIEISIEFTKEILKAIYQYQHLLTKLKGLKKTS